ELQIRWWDRDWQCCQTWISRRAVGKTRKAKLLRCILPPQSKVFGGERNRRMFVNESSDYMDTADRILGLYRSYNY
ncbi:hypothetical protein Dimus_002838, partial [Dionaea muscipula]